MSILWPGRKAKDLRMGVDYTTDSRRLVIMNNGLRGNPEIATIRRIDEGSHLPHYLILEAGKQEDSGICLFHRGPAEEFRRLEDREPIFVTASTRLGFGYEGQPPFLGGRVNMSYPSISVILSYLPPMPPEYEPQLDYVRGEELEGEKYACTPFSITEDSFRTGNLHIWNEYRPEALKAYSVLFKDGQILVHNDGVLHLLVRTSENDKQSIPTIEGKKSEVRNFEYVERSSIFVAYPGYIVHAGLSPVQPGFGMRIADTYYPASS